jgi:cytochrome c-type biogenesis protein CcmH/NrfG
MNSRKNNSCSTSASPKIPLWLYLVFLIALTALPYLQIISHDFIIWDDPYYIFDNSIVKAGLSWLGLGWAFITFAASNWHPLTWISHMLDSSLFGPTPGAAHVVNLLLYLGCVALAFFLFMRLGVSAGAAFFMTAFFGLHPLHVESVAWAAERKDLLCAFFFLAAMLSYLSYIRHNKKIFYFITTGLFILSLLSKPMAVTWPCVALLLDYWPLKRLHLDLKKTICEKIPWFVLSAIVSFLTIMAQGRSEAIKSLTDFPFTDRIANALISYVMYIRQSVWPFDLTVYYPYPYSISAISTVIAFLVLLVITIVTFLQRRQHPYLLWGWLFYVGVLFPVIGIIQVGVQAHADRYTLIPQVGLILAAGLFLDNSLKRKQVRRSAAIIMISIIIIFALLTFRQVSYWKDSATLFNQNLEVAGKNELAHFNLGAAYLQNNQLDLAITHLWAAAQMNPHDVTTFNNLGVAYARSNQTLMAEKCFHQAILLDPRAAQPHFHLAVIRFDEGNLDEAEKHIEKAFRLAPEWEEVRELNDKIKELRSNR